MKMNKLMFTGLAIASIIAQPFYAVLAGHSASAMSVDYTPTPFVLGEWSVDRALPTGGYGITNFAGQANALEMILDKNLANTSGTGFYQTEGLKRTIALGKTALKANLYVDSDWISNGKTVRAGLWGTAQDSANAISAYPIVEFTTDGFTGWRSYNTITGTWNNSAAAYNVNAWNTVEIQLDAANNTFQYLVNGINIGTASLNDSTSFKEAILNSKNYGAAAQSYGVRWSNFEIGVHVATAVTNMNTGVIYDDLQAAVDAATAGNTLRINDNLTLASDVDITKSLTIDGNGKTITASFNKTGNDNNSALAVSANDVAIKNIKLVGNNLNWPLGLHGINAYQVTNLLVDGVTAENFLTGILYNGSTGTIQNVHTINNKWHGINIDKVDSNVQVLGTNTHTETLNIYAEDISIVTIHAPAYESSHPGLIDPNTLLPRPNDRVYTLKPVVVVPPVTPTPTTPQGGNGETVKTSSSIATDTATDEAVVAVAGATDTKDADADKDAEVLGDDQATDTSSTQDSKKHWSLVNLLLAAVATVMSVITLAGIRGSQGKQRNLRLLTLVPAVVAIVALLLVEDFTAKLGWVNGWTLLFALIAIGQIALVAGNKTTEE